MVTVLGFLSKAVYLKLEDVQYDDDGNLKWMGQYIYIYK